MIFLLKLIFGILIVGELLFAEIESIEPDTSEMLNSWEMNFHKFLNNYVSTIKLIKPLNQPTSVNQDVSTASSVTNTKHSLKPTVSTNTLKPIDTSRSYHMKANITRTTNLTTTSRPTISLTTTSRPVTNLTYSSRPTINLTTSNRLTANLTTGRLTTNLITNRTSTNLTTSSRPATNLTSSSSSRPVTNLTTSSSRPSTNLTTSSSRPFTNLTTSSRPTNIYTNTSKIVLMSVSRNKTSVNSLVTSNVSKNITNSSFTVSTNVTKNLTTTLSPTSTASYTTTTTTTSKPINLPTINSNVDSVIYTPAECGRSFDEDWIHEGELNKLALYTGNQQSVSSAINEQNRLTKLDERLLIGTTNSGAAMQSNTNDTNDLVDSTAFRQINSNLQTLADKVDNFSYYSTNNSTDDWKSEPARFETKNYSENVNLNVENLIKNFNFSTSNDTDLQMLKTVLTNREEYHYFGEKRILNGM